MFSAVFYNFYKLRANYGLLASHFAVVNSTREAGLAFFPTSVKWLTCLSSSSSRNSQPQSITPPPRKSWIHEVKHDGYRTLLIIERHKARAYTRNGFDWTERYPALDCRSAIIDGEVIVQDERGVSDFEGLKSAIRWGPQSLVFCAFDLLHLNGKDFRERPLLERRAKLRELVPSGHPVFVQ
jgi:ATP-dependent DNA ligase